MQADTRSSSLWLRLFFVTVVMAASTPVAQARSGPSATGAPVGIASNPAASGHADLPTIGPDGYANAMQPFLGNCCAKYFLPHHYPHRPPKTPLDPGEQNGASAVIPVAAPVYVPYAIGYVADSADGGPSEGGSGEAGSSADQSDGPSAEGLLVRRRAPTNEAGDAPEDQDWTDIAASEEPNEVALPQPVTVLVFKDGHRSDVENYAIVGDTLFDFADDGRTVKIQLVDLDIAATERVNDAAGVEFKLPPGSGQ
jgi:hypothetical protein